MVWRSAGGILLGNVMGEGNLEKAKGICITKLLEADELLPELWVDWLLLGITPFVD